MNTTPNLVTPDQFNENVKTWSFKQKMKMLANIPRVKGELNSSLVTKQKKYYGVTNVTNFKFSPHGIYVHYGVGRGLSRVGGRVIHAKSEQNRYRKNDYKLTENQPKGRTPVDWFNSVIRDNIDDLANIAQEYYGDDAMNKILNEYDRMIIKSNK